MTFDIEARDELRKAYDSAVEKGADSFDFRGTELIVNYAKYLLEFLDIKLK